MSDVEVTLTAGGEEKNGTYTPKLGSELNIDFDPVRTKVGIDYSAQDSLSLKLEGEISIKSPALTLALDAEASAAGNKSITGTLTWNIKKELVAQAEVSYGTDGASAKGTLTLRF